MSNLSYVQKCDKSDTNNLLGILPILININSWLLVYSLPHGLKGTRDDFILRNYFVHYLVTISYLTSYLSSDFNSSVTRGWTLTLETNYFPPSVNVAQSSRWRKRQKAAESCQPRLTSSPYKKVCKYCCPSPGHHLMFLQWRTHCFDDFLLILNIRLHVSLACIWHLRSVNLDSMLC